VFVIFLQIFSKNLRMCSLSPKNGVESYKDSYGNPHEETSSINLRKGGYNSSPKCAAER